MSQDGHRGIGYLLPPPTYSQSSSHSSSASSSSSVGSSDITLPPPDQAAQLASVPEPVTPHRLSLPPPVYDALSSPSCSSSSSAYSSDAETLEPENYAPDSRSVPSPEASGGVTSALARVTGGLERAASPRSEASSDSVPPPSPAALNRYRAVSANAADSHIVQLQRERLDEVERRECRLKLLEEQKKGQLGDGFPKRDGQFEPKFERKDYLNLHHFQMSDLENAQVGDGRRASFGVLPAPVLRFLSDYQKDGITFMYRLYERRRGGMLADAMGLGKTIQTVCFLGAVFGIWDRQVREKGMDEQERVRNTPRILVICPTSVRENWKREFEIWTPFRVLIYKRTAESEIGRALRKGAVDVVISGDNPVAAHGKRFFGNPTGKEWQWDVVIVDEIHIAKNSGTKIYNALKALPKRAMFGLTGTAVQNRLLELWNVMSLVVPEKYWPSLSSFRKKYVDIITKGTKMDASSYMRKRGQAAIARLRVLLAKHMVRRPKSVIQDLLPGKSDYCVLMKMRRDGLQGYMYQRFQNSYDVKLLRDAKEDCDCRSGIVSKECCHRYPVSEEDLENAPIWKTLHADLKPCSRCPNCICFPVQYYSRSIATHALLLRPEDTEVDPVKAEARASVLKYYLGKYSEKANQAIAIAEQEANLSCKLDIALKLLRMLRRSGHKTIIFYESLRLGTILQRWAVLKGLRFEIIEGKVGKGNRQIAVDRFNNDPSISVFFISKKSGGTGLNISGADRVLIFEPCWNPSLDLQAGDRAHRLGQKRVVHIIRLVVENTIEHYVFKTALSKSQVASAILDNTKEEWRVKDDEIGSMRAMLRMGDVFADDEKADDFRLIEAENLVDDSKSRGNNEENEIPMQGLVKKADSSRSESVDLSQLDDLHCCSLNVDITAEDGNDDEVSDGEVSERNSAAVVEASQGESRILFGEAGANNKTLMMDYTIAGEQREQMMGQHAARLTSGINAIGPANVNFDDGERRDLGVSPTPKRPSRKRRPPVRVLEDEDDIEEIPDDPPPPPQKRKMVMPKRRKRSHNNSTVSKSRESKTQESRPKSVFAARARVRR